VKPLRYWPVGKLPRETVGEQGPLVDSHDPAVPAAISGASPFKAASWELDDSLLESILHGDRVGGHAATRLPVELGPVAPHAAGCGVQTFGDDSRRVPATDQQTHSFEAFCLGWR